VLFVVLVDVVLVAVVAFKHTHGDSGCSSGVCSRRYALAALLLADATDAPSVEASGAEREREARQLLRSAAAQGHALSARRLAALTGDKSLGAK
jgi:TPR repeat protein